MTGYAAKVAGVGERETRLRAEIAVPERLLRSLRGRVGVLQDQGPDAERRRGAFCVQAGNARSMQAGPSLSHKQKSVTNG